MISMLMHCSIKTHYASHWRWSNRVLPVRTSHLCVLKYLQIIKLAQRGQEVMQGHPTDWAEFRYIKMSTRRRYGIGNSLQTLTDTWVCVLQPVTEDSIVFALMWKECREKYVGSTRIGKSCILHSRANTPFRCTSGYINWMWIPTVVTSLLDTTSADSSVWPNQNDFDRVTICEKVRSKDSIQRNHILHLWLRYHRVQAWSYFWPSLAHTDTPI